MINSNTLNYNNFNLDFSVSLTFNEASGVHFCISHTLNSEHSSSTYTRTRTRTHAQFLQLAERSLRDDNVESIMALKNNRNKIKLKKRKKLTKSTTKPIFYMLSTNTSAHKAMHTQNREESFYKFYDTDWLCWCVFFFICYSRSLTRFEMFLLLWMTHVSASV